MLDIINSLKPFFEDSYRRINVREYARMQKISPPTASKILEEYYHRGLLKRESEKQYIYYFANGENLNFIDLSRIYWRNTLEDAGFIKFLEKEFSNSQVILFGSLSKAEAKIDSDIDIAIFTPEKKEIVVEEFKKKLKRDIQIFVFKDRESVKNKDLLNNILNGYKLRGNW